MADNTITGASGSALRTYEQYLQSQKVRTPNQNLGKDEFLSLLVAQMQNQDPMEPTSDTDFIAQLAQFSSLEQINALNDTMSMFQSYSLTGKFVYAEIKLEDGTTRPVAGVVDKIITKDGQAWAQVGDYQFNVSAIVEIVDLDYALGTNPLLNHSSLIGKYVSGVFEMAVTDENGDPELDEKGNQKTETVTIEGYVTGLSVDGQSGMVAELDSGIKLSLSAILDIRESKPETVQDDSGEADGENSGENSGETQNQ